MTAAVGPNSPYQCGQTLKIRNPATGREILVTIVDETAGYAQNQITLHRRAFETLGANPQQGVLNVEISPIPELEQQKWGKYLLEIIQTAYPSYQVTEYNFTDKNKHLQNKSKKHMNISSNLRGNALPFREQLCIIRKRSDYLL